MGDLASGTGTTTTVERQTCKPSASVLAARAGEFPQIPAGHVTDLLLDHLEAQSDLGIAWLSLKAGRCCDSVAALQVQSCMYEFDFLETLGGPAVGLAVWPK